MLRKRRADIIKKRKKVIVPILAALLIICIFSTFFFFNRTPVEEPSPMQISCIWFGKPATLRVSLPEGVVVGRNTDPWLNEGWLLQLTGTSLTFTVRVNQTSQFASSDTYLIIDLNDVGYLNLASLTVNGTTIPKEAFKHGTPTLERWRWPDDVYPTYFNDTYVNLGTIPSKGYKEVAVSATFTNSTGVRMHFDAHGKVLEGKYCKGLSTWSPNSEDATVLATAINRPIASFTHSPLFPCVNETATFDASASTPDGGRLTAYRWDFGDGNITTVTEPVITHVYDEVGTYNVKLTVFDSEGLNNSITKLITVVPTPVEYVNPASYVAHELNEEFSIDVVIANVTNLYSFGFKLSYNTTLLDAINVTVDFLNEPTQIIKKEIDDALGRVWINVTSLSPAQPVNGTGVLATITFKVTYATVWPETTGCILDLYDTELRDAQDRLISHHVVDGWYEFVPLVAPHADFVYSPSSPQVFETMTFNATSSDDLDGNITSYLWNFGDGNITTVNTPIITHAYAAYGDYAVNLTVTDNDGLTDSAIKMLKVTKNPVASFVYSPSLPEVGETVTFDASASTPDGGYLVNYVWNFGDGNITTGVSAIITHKFATVGTYNVTLTVNDSEGKSDSAWKTITVTAPPHADFTYLPSEPKVNDVVAFDASASTPDGGYVVSYRWSFGDGNITTVSTPTIMHVYTNAGNYTVTLNVTDSEGKWDTESKVVEVKSLTAPYGPTAKFTETPIAPYVNETVTFNAATSEPGFNGTHYMPIAWYYWDFGDGATANETDPITTHAYTDPGVYNVTLTVYAPGATPETDTATEQKTVNPTVIGGHVVIIDKLLVLTPQIGLASVVLAMAVLASVMIRRKTKQV